MLKAYTADRIFTGTDWLTNHAILTDGNFIIAVQSLNNLPNNYNVINYTNCFIAPAFIDAQIYGAAGRLLSVYPTADSLYKLYDHCYKNGTHYFLPTVATNTLTVFKDCLDAVKSYWSQGGKGVPGLHIEGPWINKTKRGAHIENLIHSPIIEEAKELLEYGKGVIKMITLAPETVSDEVITLIRSYNVIISAGHSNASYKEATTSFNEGICVATHLFNAMSSLQHREPGLAGAIMNHSSVMASIIPDGYHVDFAALSIAKKVMGERLFMITDAVTETTEGPYPHVLEGDKFVSNKILSGSALTMIKGVKNCVDKVGIELAEALRMASLYPAKVLSLGDQLGKIETGYKASLVAITNNLDFHANIH